MKTATRDRIDATNDAVERNERLIRGYFEGVGNRGDLAALDRIIGPTYINHSPGLPDPMPGPAALKPIVRAMRTGFPERHYTIEDMVVAADRAAVRVTMCGTHAGELFGMEPTGRRVEVSQFQIERSENGHIVEHWRQTDEFGLMRQLGR